MKHLELKLFVGGQWILHSKVGNFYIPSHDICIMKTPREWLKSSSYGSFQGLMPTNPLPFIVVLLFLNFVYKN